MIDWLRDDHRDPAIELSGTRLPIAIRRHARARRLTMRLAPDGSEVRVTMPRWGRTRDALVFAKARTSWLEDQLAKVPPPVNLSHGAALPYRGIDLSVAWEAGAPRKPRLVGDSLILGGMESSIQPRIRRWLESEALKLLEEDLAFYCRRAGHAERPELRLSRAQRRWGSCSGERHEKTRCIRINWRLVMAPDHVRRSVVAHEVAHLSHFDHSPAFHTALSRLFDGEIAEADNWLRERGRALYAAFG